MVIDFVDIVGPEQSSLLYLNFVKQIYDKLGKNLDFRLSLILYEGLVKIFNEDKITMTKEFHRLGELVDSYIKDYPFKEVPIFPYRVTRYYGDMLVSWLKSHTQLAQMNLRYSEFCNLVLNSRQTNTPCIKILS